MKSFFYYIFAFLLNGLSVFIIFYFFSSWLSNHQISPWLSYPLLLITPLLTLMFLKIVPQHHRHEWQGIAFGISATIAILGSIPYHWADRCLAQQKRLQEVSLEEFMMHPQDRNYAFFPCDTFMFDQMIGHVRYNVDDDKKYHGEFLVPFVLKQYPHCVFWVYEQDHFGQKRENDLIRFLKKTLGKDTVISFVIGNQPAFSWVSFKETESRSAELGFTESMVLQRMQDFYSETTLFRIKNTVFYALATGFAIMMLYSVLKVRNKI